jgi:DNA-binding beta-propeller fold protein YncE
VYISECENDRVRKVTASNGIITTIAGGGTDYDTFKGDNGAATSAVLDVPSAVALDSSGWHNYIYQMRLIQSIIFCAYIGNVYIADCWNNAIRKVTVSTDIITTIAGTFNDGFSGDGGQATSAELSEPNGVALDSAGKNAVLSLL